jgi:hypothetical protein
MEAQPSTASNSDYAAALRVWDEFLSRGVSHLDLTFGDFARLRLNPPKAAD